MGEYFSNPVRLKFDPDNLEGTVDRAEYSDNDLSVLRKVFQDGTARTFWLAIRPRFVTGPELHQGCLNVSKEIREEGVPDSAEELNSYLYRCFGQGFDKIEFAEELLPYISGELKLNYEYVDLRDI